MAKYSELPPPPPFFLLHSVIEKGVSIKQKKERVVGAMKISKIKCVCYSAV